MGVFQAVADPVRRRLIDRYAHAAITRPHVVGAATAMLAARLLRYRTQHPAATPPNIAYR